MRRKGVISLIMRLFPTHISGLLGLQWAAAAFFLAVAYVAQYGFGLAPCELCWWQRYPYMAVVALGVLSVLAPRSAATGLVWVVTVLFAIAAAVAFYHSGVEAHWWPGPGTCTAPAGLAGTLEELKAAIMDKPLVRCDEPAVQVFGLSMAMWNGLAALGVVAYSGLAMLWLRHAPRRGG